MHYHDGTPVALGDIVEVPVQSGGARAQVVMLDETYEHLNIERGFLSSVKTDRVLRQGSVVIEWLGENPFAHAHPKYAPVGKYMFIDIDEHVIHTG